MSEPMNLKQCQPDQLWYPGLQLDSEYPTPSKVELCQLWASYSTTGTAQATKGVYGVYSEPNQVKAVASVDLCEVVRDTAVSLDEATGVALGRRALYSEETWFDRTVVGSDYESSVVISVVRAVMDSGLIEPVEEIEDIRSMLQKWRSLGVYCIANTSTLPGCERGTIAYTLQRDLPDCFDGLVLPRNHSANGSMTKAEALRILAEEAQIPLQSIPSVHIDDTPHHILGFDATNQNQQQVKLFVPIHKDNHRIAKELHCTSPFDAFLKADAYFYQQGIY